MEFATVAAKLERMEMSGFIGKWLRRADIVVLTVIPVELKAASKALRIEERDQWKDPKDGTVYFMTRIRSEQTGGWYRVALACIGGEGNSKSSAVAKAALITFRPRALLLMGIGAGIRGKVQIGQVGLSEKIVAYESAALVSTPEGRREEPRPDIVSIHYSMQQDVTCYNPDPARLEKIFEREWGRYPRNLTSMTEEDTNDPRPSVVQSFVRPRFMVMATGEKLLRDPDKLLSIRERIHGKVEVGEMEAHGVCTACNQFNTPWLVIRGISDFGDNAKGNRFHDLAARTAASVLVDFIANGLRLTTTRIHWRGMTLAVVASAVLLLAGTALIRFLRLDTRPLYVEHPRCEKLETRCSWLPNLPFFGPQSALPDKNGKICTFASVPTQILGSCSVCEEGTDICIAMKECLTEPCELKLPTVPMH